MIKIKPKTRKWILHYHQCGLNHENFRDEWPIDKNGVSAVEAFFIFESTGKKIATKCPITMSRLTAGKKLHGITVDMWAQDRAGGFLCKDKLVEMCNDLPGLFEEVEKIKWAKYA